MAHVWFPNVRPRNSEMEVVGSLESLLDDYRDDIPLEIFSKLVEIYEGLDDAVSETEQILQEREEKMEELNKEIEEQKSKVEELEYELKKAKGE